MMSINPVAHSTAEIALTHWGVEMARKGGVPKERVLNCLELPAFTDFLNRRRRRGCDPNPALDKRLPGDPARGDADAGRLTLRIRSPSRQDVQSLPIHKRVVSNSARSP